MGRLSPPPDKNKKTWFVLLAILVIIIITVVGGALISYYLAFVRGPSGVPDITSIALWAQRIWES